MPADDLRCRVARGDLEAFLAPELPLLALTEPGAEWLADGAEQLCHQLGASGFVAYELGSLCPRRRFRRYVRSARLLLNLVPAPSPAFAAALAALEALCPSGP